MCIVECIVVIGILSISSEINFRWMSKDLTDEKSILVQVMVWCHNPASGMNVNLTKSYDTIDHM